MIEIIQDLKTEMAEYYGTMITFLPKLGIGIVLSLLLAVILKFTRTKITKFLTGRADDPLFVNFLDRIFKLLNYILISLFFLYIIGFQNVAGSILAAAGVSAFVIGFAFKDIGENFLAGVILAFKRPFKIGDTIKTTDVVGTIRAMTIRDTHIKTFDGKDVFVPNGQILKNPFFNYTIDGFYRKSFTIGVDYRADIQQVRAIIMKTLKKVNGVLQEEKSPTTILNEFATSTINIEVQFWFDTFDNTISALEVQTQAMRQVYEALVAAGVNMPSDIIELKNYSNSIYINNQRSEAK